MSINPLETPQQLIRLEEKSLVVNEDVLQSILHINFGSDGMRVISIAGSYHTGKSYLLNCLTGNINFYKPNETIDDVIKSQFEVAKKIEAQTKGIYIMAKPIGGKMVLFLDTQGCDAGLDEGDEKADDASVDARIMALALLLSSTMIYNTKGLLELQSMRALSSIATSVASGYANFPHLVWVLRDFSFWADLESKFRNNANEYIERMLDVRKGSADESNNAARRALAKVFPSNKRSCVPIPQPLLETENLTTQRPQAKFIDAIERLRSMLADLPPMLQGTESDVRNMKPAEYIERVIAAVQNMNVKLGNVQTFVPSLLAKISMTNAISLYREQMDRLPYPVSEDDFGAGHKKAHDNAIKMFSQEISGHPDEASFLDQLNTTIEREKARYVEINEQRLMSQYFGFASLNDAIVALMGVLIVLIFALSISPFYTSMTIAMLVGSLYTFNISLCKTVFVGRKVTDSIRTRVQGGDTVFNAVKETVLGAQKETKSAVDEAKHAEPEPAANSDATSGARRRRVD